jgi:hypothetical protein
MCNLNCGKDWPKNAGNVCNFQETVQTKQSPNERKFAQSGHTGLYVHTYLIRNSNGHCLTRRSFFKRCEKTFAACLGHTQAHKLGIFIQREKRVMVKIAENCDHNIDPRSGATRQFGISRPIYVGQIHLYCNPTLIFFSRDRCYDF